MCGHLPGTGLDPAGYGVKVYKDSWQTGRLDDLVRRLYGFIGVSNIGSKFTAERTNLEKNKQTGTVSELYSSCHIPYNLSVKAEPG